MLMVVRPLQHLRGLRLIQWALFDVFEEIKFVTRTLRECWVVDNCAECHPQLLFCHLTFPVVANCICSALCFTRRALIDHRIDGCTLFFRKRFRRAVCSA
ncbi:hypothetical protein A6R71_06265 [Xanthomonas translucens pv. arrhenatheri]|nr:hypothetical protein A6R71_06265 [Xanthomonas translucens pv. arrhenatheri]